MKFKNLALVDFESNFFDENFLSELRQFSDELIFVNVSNIEERNKKLIDVEALLVRYITSLTVQDIDALPKLKYIGASSVSMDQIDLDYAHKKNIVVKNIAGYSNNSVAEFVFGALLSRVRHLPEALKNTNKDDFTVYSAYQGWELQGKMFGVLGLGNIGQRVSELALGFGMKVQYHSRNRKAEYEQRGINYVEIEKLFETSDVIGVFLELNTETKGKIQKNHLDSVQRDSILISISHTEVFDFPALTEALKKQEFSFIQTYFSTIPNEHRDTLKGMPKVALYPSVAVQTKETRKRMQKMILDNLSNFLNSMVFKKHLEK